MRLNKNKHTNAASSRRISGISKSSLWAAWKKIRKELRKVQRRDVVDHLEYDIDPDVWIKRLLNQIAQGRYEPESPERFKAGKSLGLSRTITCPSMPDAVLYRAIADYIFRKAKRRQHKRVYFHRGDASTADRELLEALRSQPVAERQQTVSHVTLVDSVDEWSGYGFGESRSLSWFQNWKLLTLHRLNLIKLKTSDSRFVLTDITNFFDSVLHDHVVEALRQFSIPPRMIGLLLFLLERLAVRDEYAHSPAIGLPVDQLDGSRTIAHLVLFAHDDEMAASVGEERYLRWMDDQFFVAKSYKEALQLLGTLQASLSRLHLTPNAKKTRILNRKQALRHYHIDVNRELDDCYLLPYKTNAERHRLGLRISGVWSRFKRDIDNGHGESGKVLKRFYLLTARAGRRFLLQRCLRDVLKDPTMAERVAGYFRHVGSATEFWQFTRKLMEHPEQVYGDVNLTMVEQLLRLEPDAHVSQEIRAFAAEFLKKPSRFVGGDLCAAVAPLLLLRFGDGRSLRPLKSCLKEPAIDRLSAPLIRACGIVYASQGSGKRRDLEVAAAKLLRNRLSEIVRLLRRLMAYEEVPARFKNRVEVRQDSLTRRHFVDMRTLLTARLLGANKKPAVQQWVKDWKVRAIQKGISNYDKALIDRLIH